MKGWLAIAAWVVAYDVGAELTGAPTLSTVFRRATRRHPIAMTSGTAYLIAHLYGLIPPERDPLGRCFRLLVGAKSIS